MSPVTLTINRLEKGYTVQSRYTGHVYKAQPVIRDRLAGAESFPFNAVLLTSYKGQPFSNIRDS